VPRPHLIERLDEGLRLGGRLTLVSAPAGFGKTTLVTEWLHRIEQPFTWLSLDVGDNQMARFLAYLVAAKPDIFNGAIDQLFEQIFIIGSGMGATLFIPTQDLSGGRFMQTSLTLATPGPDTNIGFQA
jgi:hypothetical protein